MKRAVSFAINFREAENIAETKGCIIVFSAPESCDET
jgi:hypothetical protein